MREKEMKYYAAKLEFRTRGLGDVVDITDDVNKLVQASEISNGIALLFAPHATGAMIVNELEDSLIRDLKRFLDRILPSDVSYEHPENAFSHLRSMLLEPSKVLPVRKGRLELGTWQSVIWVEVDVRPRPRTLLVNVIGTG